MNKRGGKDAEGISQGKPGKYLPYNRYLFPDVNQGLIKQRVVPS
jgi:hypothetical protein